MWLAFIRRRLSGKQDGSYSYQILESYREGGKIKQRNLSGPGGSARQVKAALGGCGGWAIPNYQESLGRHLDSREKPAQ